MRLELTGIRDTTGRSTCLVTSQDCNQEEGGLMEVGGGGGGERTEGSEERVFLRRCKSWHREQHAQRP